MIHLTRKSKSIFNASKTGFTLAEILVTITIIGVIASLTIPDLVAGVQEDSLKAAWKKDFNIMAAATQNIMEDNGGTMSGFSRLNGNNSGIMDSDDMTLAYSSYLNNVKRCSWYEHQYECWNPTNTDQDIRGRTFEDNFTTGLILTDGTLVHFLALSYYCTASNFNLPNSCGGIIVDVNGFKKPNTYGRDIFGMHVFLDGSVKPWGTPEDDFHRVSFCSTTRAYSASESQGWACSYNYLLNIGMEN